MMSNHENKIYKLGRNGSDFSLHIRIFNLGLNLNFCITRRFTRSTPTSVKELKNHFLVSLMGQ